MADVKISQLPSATTIDGTELVPVVQAGVTKHVEASLLKGQTGATGPQGPQGPAGPTGPQGPAGADGTSVALKGSVNTTGDLPAGAADGDLYVVLADGNGYVWDGSSWANVGPIRGPAGPQGATGATGPQGLKGDTGDTGPQGPTGATGPQGPAGTTTWAGITDKPPTFPPDAHTHTAAQISDATAVGRAVLAAADAAAARAAIGVGVGAFKNKIINGKFGINRRIYASGSATTSGQYTFDRWKVTGTGGITFATTSNKTTVTIPAGQTLQQVIEGLNLETGTYVLSWGGTAQGRINGGAYGASGTVTASLTGGSNATIEFNTGTVENVQLEIGSVATPFEHRPYGLELALCQRYYPRVSSDVAYGPYAIGGLVSTTATQAIINFPVTARVAPTGIETSSPSLFTVSTDSILSVSAISFALSTTQACSVQFTHATGVSGAIGRVRGDAGSFIGFTGCEL